MMLKSEPLHNKRPSRDAAIKIIKRLRSRGYEAYLVGGYVRDLLRGIEPVDFDIVTSARPEEVCALFPQTVPVGVQFGVVLVVEDGVSYEIATFRTESSYEDGRRPSHVSYRTAEEDVKRRDFTINALLFDPLSGEIIDFVGGRQDIENRVIRTIGDPEERFTEDHLRMLRAIRFAANLDFDLDPSTYNAIRAHAKMINRISAERIRDELTKILIHGRAKRGMELLVETGLLVEVLPEVDALRGVTQPPEYHPEGDVWEHILRMLALLPSGEGVENDYRLAWGILFHDIGKATTWSENETGIHFYGHVGEGKRIAETIMRRLKFSRADAETILELVEYHMHFLNIKEMRPHKLKRFLRMPNFPLHLELHRLDCLGSHGNLDNYTYCREKLDEIAMEEMHPPRLLSGEDLIEMGFTPGPLFGEILRAVEDAQLDGEIRTPEDARRMVKMRWGNTQPS